MHFQTYRTMDPHYNNFSPKQNRTAVSKLGHLYTCCKTFHRKQMETGMYPVQCITIYHPHSYLYTKGFGLILKIHDKNFKHLSCKEDLKSCTHTHWLPHPLKLCCHLPIVYNLQYQKRYQLSLLFID